MSKMNFFMQYTGLLVATGNDVVDFFNRMTTNDIAKTGVNENIKTVLLTDKGRIIDLLTLFRRGEKLFIKTSYNYESKVNEYLNKYIVMDDVSLTKCDGQFVNFIVFGEGKDKAMLRVSEYESKVTQDRSQQNLLLYYSENIGFESLEVICHLDKSHEIRTLLSEGNFQTCIDYEYMRILSGYPEAPGELNENINPLECGLKKFVSFKKGCYVGQEVIARLDSQDKIPKQMVRISSDEILEKDALIFDRNGAECGFVSSVAVKEGKNVALGFVRSVNLDFDSEYKSVIGEKQIIIKIHKTN
jgi:folate-binding protein YgfZ